jgi:hypothetical protein
MDLGIELKSEGVTYMVNDNENKMIKKHFTKMEIDDFNLVFGVLLSAFIYAIYWFVEIIYFYLLPTEYPDRIYFLIFMIIILSAYILFGTWLIKRIKDLNFFFNYSSIVVGMIFGLILLVAYRIW